MDKKFRRCSTHQFEELLLQIKASGYKLLGPTVRDEVIIYDELQSAQRFAHRMGG